jgi:pimeloyl-ACP methyl ester carboxylesterase
VSEQRLPSGAWARTTGPAAGPAVVCANGGQGQEVPGTWSASLEWLVGRLAPRLPRLRFVELRYRIKSWRRLDDCARDLLEAIELTGAGPAVVVGYSMGGAVAVRAAPHTELAGIVGLAPWLPKQLDLSPLRGRRLAVLHGALDRPLPGIPGVSAASSRRGVERARRLGVDASYTSIPGALHGIALRAPWGAPVPLPRARRWVELTARELQALTA